MGSMPLDIVAPPGLGRRHLQILLLFVGMSITYSIRVNLGVCIVEMTARNSTRGYPVYPWDQSQRGLLLSSFFWGYVLTQVPAGMLAQRYGPRPFLLLGVVGSAVLSMVTPLAAAVGWQLVCALRMAEGLFQGLIFPSSHTMLSRWAPPLERGRFSALVYSGMSFGTVATMAGVGALADSPLGWPAGFYVPGLIGVLWGVAWYLLGASSPDTCTRISAAERAYIKEALGKTSSSGGKPLSTPWMSLLTSLPFLCLIASQCAQGFGHWMLITQMPNFMGEVLHFDIKKNGLCSSLPYLGLFFCSMFVAWVSQVVNQRTSISIGASRRLFNSIGQFSSGTALLLLALLPVGTVAAVALLVVAVSAESFILAGYMVNHVDLSPNFAGTMMGITNGCGNTMGIFAPIFVSVVLGDTSGITFDEVKSRWCKVFIVAACIWYFGNAVFVIGGRGEVQSWNNPSKSVAQDDAEVALKLVQKKSQQGYDDSQNM